MFYMLFVNFSCAEVMINMWKHFVDTANQNMSSNV